MEEQGELVVPIDIAFTDELNNITARSYRFVEYQHADFPSLDLLNVKVRATPVKKTYRSDVKPHSTYFSLFRNISVQPRANGSRYTNTFYNIARQTSDKLYDDCKFGTTGSWAFASVRDGIFYTQNGCCAAISTLDHKDTGYIYYYIPDVLPMSTKKKIEYIKRLASIITHRTIEVIDIQNTADGFTTPGSILTPTRVIDPPLRAKQYIVIKVQTLSPIERLYFLQFLRPLYQEICIGSQAYNQPRLFFKLDRLFPNIPDNRKLWLSFIMHGFSISKTYFPFYWWQMKFKTANPPKDKGVEGLINNHVSQVNNFTIRHTWIPKNVTNRDLNFEDLGISDEPLIISRHYVSGNDLYAYLQTQFLLDTKRSFRNCIMTIATLLREDIILKAMTDETTDNRD